VRIWIHFLLATFLCWNTPFTQAQSDKTRYSNVWRPITTQGISDGIVRNRTNGVGLEQIMASAMMQQKSLEYLLAIKAASDKEPKNATLLAAYAWALAQVRNSYTFTNNPAPIPERLQKKFDFSWQNVRDTIQRAKELDPRCWLAYIAESTLEPGGPPPTKEAAASKRAFQIQRNPVTLTRYGRARMFEAAGAQDDEGVREGHRLLLLAEQLYPTYYRVSYDSACSYYYPAVLDKTKGRAGFKRFYLNIPPENRNSPWVVRYLKYLEIDKELAQSGVTVG
jgi:hypothetical protein